MLIGSASVGRGIIGRLPIIRSVEETRICLPGFVFAKAITAERDGNARIIVAANLADG